MKTVSATGPWCLALAVALSICLVSDIPADEPGDSAATGHSPPCRAGTGPEPVTCEIETFQVRGHDVVARKFRPWPSIAQQPYGFVVFGTGLARPRTINLLCVRQDNGANGQCRLLSDLESGGSLVVSAKEVARFAVEPEYGVLRSTVLAYLSDHLD